MVSMSQQFFEERRTVGFDLDMTLVDTSLGIHASLVATSQETGVAIDADGIVTRLGPPIQTELAKFFPEDEVEAALQIFRKHMGTVGVQAAERLPGADRAVDIVRTLGGRVVVLTAKHQPLAIATLEHVGLRADEVIGDLWAEQKAEALKAAEAWGYVGDHTKDMLAANMAGVQAIGVTTGACSADELWQAGAHKVLSTLEEFPGMFTPPPVLRLGYDAS